MGVRTGKELTGVSVGEGVPKVGLITGEEVTDIPIEEDADGVMPGDEVRAGEGAMTVGVADVAGKEEGAKVPVEGVRLGKEEGSREEDGLGANVDGGALVLALWLEEGMGTRLVVA